jgi:hypothetical protein
VLRTEKENLKWKVGPVVVPEERDYAAASMRKAEKTESGKGKKQKLRG